MKKKKRKKLPKGWKEASDAENEEFFDSMYNPLALMAAHNMIMQRERNN